jgi:outer membrane protein assembly factor BamB
MRPFFVILVFLAVLVPAVAHAKRGPKPKVDPVDYQGVRYTPHGDGRTQYVQALDIKTGKLLWDVAVFSTTIIPLLEEDVQWVFIKQMFIDDAKLIVVAEDDRAYSLELKTGTVKRLKHAPPQKTQANKPAAANPGWRTQICREPGWFSDVILSGVAEPER